MSTLLAAASASFIRCCWCRLERAAHRHRRKLALRAASDGFACALRLRDWEQWAAAARAASTATEQGMLVFRMRRLSELRVATHEAAQYSHSTLELGRHFPDVHHRISRIPKAFSLTPQIPLCSSSSCLALEATHAQELIVAVRSQRGWLRSIG